MTRLQIVGGGRMGEALAGGIVGAGWGVPSDLRIVEMSAPRRLELADRFPGSEITDHPGGADGTVIAVKPGDVPAIVREVVAQKGGRILSIAAGVTIAQIEE